MTQTYYLGSLHTGVHFFCPDPNLYSDLTFSYTVEGEPTKRSIDRQYPGKLTVGDVVSTTTGQLIIVRTITPITPCEQPEPICFTI